MFSSLGLSRSLRSLVTTKFQQAKQAEEVSFSETQLATLRSPGLTPFQFRYLPSLAKKPTDQLTKTRTSTADQAKETSPQPNRTFDPFENPSDSLLVARIPLHNPLHNLVLNKFPVIPNHFILATIQNKPQVYPLEVEDIYMTYKCVQDWSADGQPSLENHPLITKSASLFAFFNSGAESGASQPHRHVQFLPIEDMKETENSDWSALVTTMTEIFRADINLLHNPALPFLHYAVDIKAHMSAEELHQRYLFLLRVCAASMTDDLMLLSKQDIDRCPITFIADNSHDRLNRKVIARGDETLQHEVLFDYNLCITIEKMAIIPRLRGNVKVRHTDPEDGSISINGTILAGTLMTKSEKHWHIIRENPELLHDLLSQIGYPKAAAPLGEQKNSKDKL